MNNSKRTTKANREAECWARLTRYEKTLLSMEREVTEGVAVRQCLRIHPRVYDGLGVCAKCR